MKNRNLKELYISIFSVTKSKKSDNLGMDIIDGKLIFNINKLTKRACL